MLPLGTTVPDFSLLDTVTDTMMQLEDLVGEKGTVVMFICNHCPFVKHLNSAISEMARTYQPMGIGFIAISSNDIVNFPQDAPDVMKLTAKNEGYVFPYLYDHNQEVARSFDAACTPDFYVFDAASKLVYRGQFDDSRPGNGIPITGKDLQNALDALLVGHPISPNQKPSIGCNIKWVKSPT